MLALGCDQAGYGLMQEVKKHLSTASSRSVDWNIQTAVLIQRMR